MRKKQIITILMVAGMLAVLNGCSGAPKEKQIQQDFETSYFLEDGEQISQFSVEKRKTEKDEETVWCTVITQDEDRSYEKKYVLSYYKYDKGGWTLEDIEEDDTASWTVAPLKGVSEEDAKDSLDYESVQVNGEEWDIYTDDYGNVDSVTIKDQKTDLEAGTDTLTMEITIDGLVEKATGTVEAKYVFDSNWELDSLTGNDDFTVEKKPECAFNFDENSVIEFLQEQPLSFGNSDDGTYQEVKVNADEIKNFKVESQTESMMGEAQRIVCSFGIEKKNISFLANGTLNYSYDSSAGWKVQEKEVNIQVDTINILGEWVGRYEGYEAGASKLNIKSVEENRVVAEYTYTPDTIDEWDQEGCYEVSGTIDESTLAIDLSTGDWITEPTHTLANEKHGINAVFYVDDETIGGTAQWGREFKVKRADQ